MSIKSWPRCSGISRGCLRGTRAVTLSGMSAWIFQGNPDQFDVDAYVRRESEVLWTVRQAHYAKDMCVGDRVFIWRSAGAARGRAGVVAIGKIIETPRERTDDQHALALWRDPEAGRVAALRVGIKIDLGEDAQLLDRKTIATTDTLHDLMILKMANQTNYKISAAEESSLLALWNHAPQKPGRNPPWARDELLLALEFYLRAGLRDDRDPEVVALSEVLRSLPIYADRPDPERFRNANAVALKLANFRSIDQPGRGMAAASELDRRVWDEFHAQPAELRVLADAIRQSAAAADRVAVANPEEDEDEVAEGRLLYRLHRSRERHSGLVRDKKQRVLRECGRLACEVCGFDFHEVYGERGAGFAECHHRVALATTGETTTRLADLALVCANCHRVIHRGKPWPTVEGLRAEVRGLRVNAPKGRT